MFSIPKNNFFVAEQNGALIISTGKEKKKDDYITNKKVNKNKNSKNVHEITV